MRKYILYTILIGFAFVSCKKNSYYQDTGINDPKFDGTIMEYLESNPFYFDTLVRIIKYAELEETLNTETITFFAPPNPTFKKSLDALNNYQLSIGEDSVKNFEQVKPDVWKELLSAYIFKGDRGLKDFAQVDTLALDTYKGTLFESLQGATMNIGTIFNDAVNGDVTIKYQGYRQLLLSYVPDDTKPYSGWVNCPVSTSDIAPSNGRVHVLRYLTHTFGFTSFSFIKAATERGVD